MSSGFVEGMWNYGDIFLWVPCLYKQLNYTFYSQFMSPWEAKLFTAEAVKQWAESMTLFIVLSGHVESRDH